MQGTNVEDFHGNCVDFKFPNGYVGTSYVGESVTLEAESGGMVRLYGWDYANDWTIMSGRGTIIFPGLGT